MLTAKEVRMARRALRGPYSSVMMSPEHVGEGEEEMSPPSVMISNPVPGTSPKLDFGGPMPERITTASGAVRMSKWGGAPVGVDGAGRASRRWGGGGGAVRSAVTGKGTQHGAALAGRSTGGGAGAEEGPPDGEISGNGRVRMPTAS